MISNATLRRHMHEAAEQNRAGNAWRQAGYQLIEILRLYQESLRAEREGHNNLADIIRDKCQEAAAGGTSVRSGWTANANNLEAEHFRIDLAGGGPAVRIIGDLDRFKQPCNPVLQYQDWGTPWTEFRLMNDIERNAAQWFCSNFYWGD